MGFHGVGMKTIKDEIALGSWIGRAWSIAGYAVLAFVLLAPQGVLADANHRTQGSSRAGEATGTRPAVAAPNFRFGLYYDYRDVDSTETSFFDQGESTLRIPSHDSHEGRAQLVGTLPLIGPLGARVEGHARYGHTNRSLDGLGRGNDEVTTLGVLGEVFLRDPDLGSFAVGAGYDRYLGSGSLAADEYSGTVSAGLFFPDLGSGPIDWMAHFRFGHRKVSGTTGTADVDADRYTVRGSVGWYFSDDFQMALGAEWDRDEEEFSTEEDLEGFIQFRWRLPVKLPLEFSVGGSAGISEYKQSPFRSDHRFVYGMNAGLVFRFGSGKTLIESIRGYD